MEQLLAFCDWERKHNPLPDGKPHIAEWAAAELERLYAQVDAWRGLYRLAINEANGLTNYVEDRPGLRSAERRIKAIERNAVELEAQRINT
jgi:hypothetical protein